MSWVMQGSMVAMCVLVWDILGQLFDVLAVGECGVVCGDAIATAKSVLDELCIVSLDAT